MPVDEIEPRLVAARERLERASQALRARWHTDERIVPGLRVIGLIRHGAGCPRERRMARMRGRMNA
jgi:hypothetical protein